MTKTVRIENACTSPYKVRVRVEAKNAEGEWVADINAPAPTLDYPTRQVEQLIHSHKRLVVEEYE